MTGCWNWTRSTDTNGYGRVWIRTHFVTAPRLSWMLFKGGIRGRLHVLHKCDNRKCINPSHLFLGTHADNMKDKKNKGRCPKPLAKLNQGNADMIRLCLANGLSCKELAKIYKVNLSQIYRIKNNQTWKQRRQDSGGN